MINFEFKSIIELVKAFPDEQTCINHLELLRWDGNVVSPFDPTSKVYKCAGNKYRCKNTRKYFNVRTATLFDNTKIPLQKWFMAIYLITSHKKGISSVQLGKDIDVTQKTAWFMNHRIRNCFGIVAGADTEGKIGGGGQIVEIDETYPGGRLANMTKKKRQAYKEGKYQSSDNKTPVMGYLVRGGNLTLNVVPDPKHLAFDVIDTVSREAVIFTDGSDLYHPISTRFAGHMKVYHSKDEYVRDTVHTNGIEGAFSMFDRMVIGTYHYISPKHMQKYCNELTFRYNSREVSESLRFNLMLMYAGKRLTYNQLIAE